jgi:hypothetical protein
MLATLLAGCGWVGDIFATEDEPKTTVTLHGKVAVPDGPSDYAVLTANSHLAYQWYTCFQGENDTSKTITDGRFLLESTNNCASAQYVYFYPTSPVDRKDMATGRIEFKIQVNSAAQGATLAIQDANTVAASVDIGAYGYDAGKVGLDQLISVPVTALAGPDLSRIARPFQLTSNCGTSDCYTTLSEIRWVPGNVAIPAPFTPSAMNRTPHCDPFPCRGLPRARVGMVRATQLGWTAVPVASTTTDSDGDYSIEVEASVLSGGGPIFIAVTDADGLNTLLSTIPNAFLQAGDESRLDVDRTTTAVGMMVCPNGITVPADGSGGWCIGDPISTTEITQLDTAVDAAFTTTVSIDIEVFWDDVIDDPQVLAALNSVLGAHGLPATTGDVLNTLGNNISIPVVTAKPVSTGGTTGGTPGGGTVTGDKTCSQYMSGCQVCSISACSVSNADGSCSTWYETSDGQKYACASCGDCYGAAQQVTQHCCPAQ